MPQLPARLQEGRIKEIRLGELGPPLQVGITDSFSGAEVLSINTQIPISESLSLAESLSIQAQLAISDTLYPQHIIPILNSRLGEAILGRFRLGEAESLDIQQPINVSDSLSLADSLDIQSLLTILDSFLGAEALVITRFIDITDALSLIDRKLPSSAEKTRLKEFRLGEAVLPESVPTVSITAFVPMSDSLLGAENIGLNIFADVSDSFIGAENILVEQLIAASDSIAFGGEIIFIDIIVSPRVPRSPKSIKVFKFVTSWIEDVEG